MADTERISLREASMACGVGVEVLRSWLRDSGIRPLRVGGGKFLRRSKLADCLRDRGLPVPIDLDPWPRVLVVEEDEELRLLIERMLREWWKGAEVRGAGDGLEAKGMLARYQPDLAIVDLKLPGRDGLSLCRDVAAKPGSAHTRILVMTGSRYPGASLRALAGGAAELIRKPFRLEELRAAAQRLLGSYS